MHRSIILVGLSLLTNCANNEANNHLMNYINDSDNISQTVQFKTPQPIKCFSYKKFSVEFDHNKHVVCKSYPKTVVPDNLSLPFLPLVAPVKKHKT